MASLRRPSEAQSRPGRTCLPLLGMCWQAVISITVEVLGWRGLVTYYVLFFIPLESRRVTRSSTEDRSGEAPRIRGDS